MSDIDTEVVDSLNALDPERPIREADINHHLFSAVVIALIRLVQFGGPVEIRPSTPWHGSLQSAAASVI